MPAPPSSLVVKADAMNRHPPQNVDGNPRRVRCVSAARMANGAGSHRPVRPSSLQWCQLQALIRPPCSPGDAPQPKGSCGQRSTPSTEYLKRRAPCFGDPSAKWAYESELRRARKSRRAGWNIRGRTVSVIRYPGSDLRLPRRECLQPIQHRACPSLRRAEMSGCDLNKAAQGVGWEPAK
jgi:hypothetical protein